MQDKLERLVRLVYKSYKQGICAPQLHPNVEDIACFLENRLSQEESESMKEHLIACDSCAEPIAMQLKLKPAEDKNVPQELLSRVKGLLKTEDRISVLEIFLRLKEKALEILNTTGDILVDQELIPAPVLRSRSIKDFKDEVTILKDFKDIRVEVKLENKQAQAFRLTVMLKEKDTQRILKDLRVTLIQDDLELESYLTDSGKVIFEHILLGKYTVEISTIDQRLASILIDVKI